MLRRFFPAPIDVAPDETDPTASSRGRPRLVRRTRPGRAADRRDHPTPRGDPPRRTPRPAGSSSCSHARSARPRPRPAEPRRWSPTTPRKKSEIAGLERELQRIQQSRFVVQQARGYGLGRPEGDRRSPWGRARRRSRPMPLDPPGRGSAPHKYGDPARELADAPVRPRRLIRRHPWPRTGIRPAAGRERALRRVVRPFRPDGRPTCAALRSSLAWMRGSRSRPHSGCGPARRT